MDFRKNKKLLISLASLIVVLIAAVILVILSYNSFESHNETKIKEINGSNSTSIVTKRMTDKNLKAKLVTGVIYFLKNKTVHFFRNFEVNLHENVLINALKKTTCDVDDMLTSAIYYYSISDQKVFEPVILAGKKIDLMADASWLANLGSYFCTNDEIDKYQAFYDSIKDITFNKNTNYFTIFHFTNEKTLQIITISLSNNNDTKLQIRIEKSHTFDKSAYNAVAYLFNKCDSNLTSSELKEIDDMVVAQ